MKKIIFCICLIFLASCWNTVNKQGDIFLENETNNKKWEDTIIKVKDEKIVDNLNWIPQSPNVLLIIADDMWLDACPWYDEYKWEKPNTPNLDKLAENGLVFENVWSNPLCSPTRSTILTWKYWFSTWVLGALWKDDDWVSIEEYSLQTMITEKSSYNYNQAVIGKWHLATDNNWGDNNPELMWVPYYSGFLWWTMKSYYKWKKTTNWESKLVNNYSTSEFSDDSIEWIEENKNEPWFLWLAYTAPHTPFHVPPQDLLSTETYSSLNTNFTQEEIDSNPLPYYLSAIEAMDSEIGRVLDNMSKEDKENTIVIFIWDNWTPGQVAQTPYNSKEVKWSISRWWIHIPMIISWVWIDYGRVEEYINTSDLYTTIAELSGIDITTYWNSISFAPILFWNEREVERSYMYSEVQSPSVNWWASRKNGWTIKKDWYQYISLDIWTEKLFLDSDLWQTNNLINSESQIAKELKELWEKIREKSIWATYNQYPSDPNDIVCYDDSEEIIENNN